MLQMKRCSSCHTGNNIKQYLKIFRLSETTNKSNTHSIVGVNGRQRALKPWERKRPAFPG